MKFLFYNIYIIVFYLDNFNVMESILYVYLLLGNFLEVIINILKIIDSIVKVVIYNGV